MLKMDVISPVISPYLGGGTIDYHHNEVCMEWNEIGYIITFTNLSKGHWEKTWGKEELYKVIVKFLFMT